MVYNYSPVQYSDTTMLWMALRMAPGMLWRRRRYGRGVDVFVTHSPPRGIHDMPDRPHTGFRALRLVIDWYRPRYLIHGHVDVLDRRRPTETVVDQTVVININPCRVLTVDPLR
jgi:Icc-related predicted phosphoesterase